MQTASPMSKKVMYHGERVGFNSKTIQLFKDRAGHEYRYVGIKGVYPGSLYEVKPGDKMSVKPKEYEAVEGWEMTEKERLEYEAQKELCKLARLERRKAMELKKPHADIVRAVELLRPFYRSLDHIDQSRFTTYLRNQMSRKAKK